MITLYSFPPLGNLPSLSPFCFKLETYLKLAGLDYKTVYPGMPGKAPKGKLPYIEENGRTIADSGFIIDHLEAARGGGLDAGMGEAERAVAHAFRRLFEENLYWGLVYARWLDEANWPQAKRALFGKAPLPIKLIGPPLARRAVRKEIMGHGMGRHSREEIYRIALADLKAASAFLGDKPYFMGDKPRTIDATAHAFLTAILFAEGDFPIRAEMDRLTNLKAYCERLHLQAFGKPPVA